MNVGSLFYVLISRVTLLLPGMIVPLRHGVYDPDVPYTQDFRSGLLTDVEIITGSGSRIFFSKEIPQYVSRK